MPTYYVANYGNNANNGTSPSTPWATVQFALGAASGTNPGLVAGDTVWIAPGTYREVITSTTLTGASANTIKIYGDPKFTRAWTVGNAGRVRVTNYLSDSSLPTASQVLAIIGDYVDIQDLCIDGNPVSVGGPNIPAQSCLFIRGGNNSVTRCTVQTSNEGRGNAFQIHLLTGKKTCVVSQCAFLSTMPVWISSAAQTNPFDVDVTIQDCLIMAGPDYAIVTEGATSSLVGYRLYNNTVMNSNTNAIYFINHSSTSSTATIVRNNLIYSSRGGGVGATASITITQSNNTIICGTTFTNISPTTNNFSPPVFDFGSSRLQQFGMLPWFAPSAGSPVIGAGTATGASTVDFYGNTWTSTPTIGAIESKTESDNGFFIPTEMQPSATRLTPGSTNNSITVFLGFAGLTFNTPNLVARYTRNNATSVAVPLVAQTVGGAWVAGGFCEIDPLNLPGFYRFDLPNQAIDNYTTSLGIAIKGAVGTNGAYITAELEQSTTLISTTGYKLISDQQGANGILDVVKGSSITVKLQITDVNQKPVPIGSATCTVQVYSLNNLVATYPTTIQYQSNGEMTFVLDTTVTAVPGSYSIYVNRNNGGSDTVLYGPMKLTVSNL